MDDEDFTIPYVTDKIPSSPAGNKLPKQAKRYVCIIAINWEGPIIAQGAIDELNHHQNSCGKLKFKIIICRRKSYQRKYLEDICLGFYQVRPVVSHLEVLLP